MMRLPSCKWPAVLAASLAMPSIAQPSPKKANVWLLISSKPGLLNSAAVWACAMARPTAFAKPWPKGPVVTSTPGVSWASG